MLPMFYAALNVVIEGWQQANQAQPRLTDAVIDELLTEPHAETLQRFRHASMHANDINDPRVISFASTHSDIAPWARS